MLDLGKGAIQFFRDPWTGQVIFLSKVKQKCMETVPSIEKINPCGQFFYRELSAILDAQLFPTFLKPNS
jgi:hypothetical protein